MNPILGVGFWARYWLVHYTVDAQGTLSASWCSSSAQDWEQVWMIGWLVMMCIQQYLQEWVRIVKIIHKGALLCPVSETELWRELQNTDLVPSVRDWREETLGMKISTIQTKQTRENSVTQKPQITWSTWKGNSWSNHCKCATQHKESAQTLNINTDILSELVPLINSDESRRSGGVYGSLDSR